MRVFFFLRFPRSPSSKKHARFAGGVAALQIPRNCIPRRNCRIERRKGEAEKKRRQGLPADGKKKAKRREKREGRSDIVLDHDTLARRAIWYPSIAINSGRTKRDRISDIARFNGNYRAGVADKLEQIRAGREKVCARGRWKVGRNYGAPGEGREKGLEIFRYPPVPPVTLVSGSHPPLPSSPRERETRSSVRDSTARRTSRTCPAADRRLTTCRVTTATKVKAERANGPPIISRDAHRRRLLRDTFLGAHGRSLPLVVRDRFLARLAIAIPVLGWMKYRGELVERRFRRVW